MKGVLLGIVLCMGMTLGWADDETNVLLYKDPVQVSSSVDAYENLRADTPIQGLVMVTYNAGNKIDGASFRMGDQPLTVNALQTVEMPDSKLKVAIYKFQIAGKKTGQYTLPSIFVKVGGKEYQAPPLTIQVGN